VIFDVDKTKYLYSRAQSCQKTNEARKVPTNLIEKVFTSVEKVIKNLIS